MNFHSSPNKPVTADHAVSILNDSALLDELARESGFRKRNRGAITPEVFVHSLLGAANLGSPSCRQLAVLAGIHCDKTIAKQSFWQRLNSRAFDFVSSVLCAQLRGDQERDRLPDLVKGVKRVLVADSTCLPVNATLARVFSGARNQRRKHAGARLQFVMDLLSGQFVQIGLSAYTSNDQAAACEVIDVLKPGDLLLRDLGYFTLKSLHAIDAVGAWFLSRLRYGTALYDEQGQRIDLLKILRESAHTEGEPVILKAVMGKRKKLGVRIVALKLSEEQARERRRRARENRDKRLNHSEEYYQLLDWSIYVTNLPECSFEASQLAALYPLRWRIENVFKAWKGRLRPERISRHRTNQWHLKCLLLGQMLLLSQLGLRERFAVATRPSRSGAPSSGPRQLSIFKLFDVLALAGHPLHTPIEDLENRVLIQLHYHAPYEARKRRPLPERINQFLG